VTSGGDAYVESDVQRMLTEHPDLSEQGLTLRRGEASLLVQGEVESEHRRDEVRRLITEHFPDVHIECDIGVTRTQAPVDAEEL
jgi:hypothetical protein